METLVGYFIIAAWYGCLAFLCLFSVHRYQLLYLYYRYRWGAQGQQLCTLPRPRVTVQLPLYNEPLVVERLIRSVAQLDHPSDLLQIQVLDDSTDETSVIARRVCKEVAADGVHIEYIHRTDREGYKAGALQSGLRTATGEFIAIFDADFVPPADFLLRTLPHFVWQDVAMVQARWDHLNREQSLLTRCQALLLDGHFVIEHAARNWSGRFFNFNGTAGVWRRAAIDDAGGWDARTLTEDMDLSYRAQLRDWKFVYLPEVTAPGELPPDIHGFKSQQFRWTKGALQVARLQVGRIWRSKESLKVKIEATFHLCNPIAYLALFVLSLLTLPAMWVRGNGTVQIPMALDIYLFAGTLLSVGNFYLAAQRELGRPLWRGALALPMMLCLGIGMCANNARAGLEALLGKGGEFVRTPKYGDSCNRAGQSLPPLRAAGMVVELLLAIYYAIIIGYCIGTGNYFVIPFMLFFLFGFGYVGLQSALGWRRANAQPEKQLVAVTS